MYQDAWCTTFVYKIGLTKVFFKSDDMAELEERRDECPIEILPMVAALYTCQTSTRVKSARSLPPLYTCQTSTRGKSARSLPRVLQRHRSKKACGGQSNWLSNHLIRAAYALVALVASLITMKKLENRPRLIIHPPLSSVDS